MEKTLTIDGQKVTFKSSGATPIRYRAQFNRDYFQDIIKMQKAAKESKLENKKPEEVTAEDLEGIDFEVFYRIVWVLAKTANKEISDLEDWLDDFEYFPIEEIVPELFDVIAASLQSKKKIQAGKQRKK